eukprot:3969622-Alexandrium_andersonii.AAC.1
MSVQSMIQDLGDLRQRGRASDEYGASGHTARMVNDVLVPGSCRGALIDSSSSPDMRDAESVG